MDLQSEWNAVSQMVPRENTASCDANDRSSYQEALHAAMDDPSRMHSAVGSRTRSRCARRPEFHTHSQEPALRVKSARPDGYLHRNRRRFCNDHRRRMATRKARHQNRPDASLAHRIAGENPRWFPVSMSHLDDLALIS